jgi:hypothetical protein
VNPPLRIYSEEQGGVIFRLSIQSEECDNQKKQSIGSWCVILRALSQNFDRVFKYVFVLGRICKPQTPNERENRVSRIFENRISRCTTGKECRTSAIMSQLCRGVAACHPRLLFADCKTWIRIYAFAFASVNINSERRCYLFINENKTNSGSRRGCAPVAHMSHNAEVRQVKSLEDAPSTIITNSITGHRKLRIDHHCYASSSLERTTDFRSCRNENCFLFYLGPSRRSAELRPLHPLNLRAARKQIAATDGIIRRGRPINWPHPPLTTQTSTPDNLTIHPRILHN